MCFWVSSWDKSGDLFFAENVTRPQISYFNIQYSPRTLSGTLTGRNSLTGTSFGGAFELPLIFITPKGNITNKNTELTFIIYFHRTPRIIMVFKIPKWVQVGNIVYWFQLFWNSKQKKTKQTSITSFLQKMI